MTHNTGCVKWFNTKTGYGFIRCLDANTDVFVHHTAIRTILPYKYLVQGEYVEFERKMHSDKEDRIVACNVTGIRGGKLMCETRAENQPQK